MRRSRVALVVAMLALAACGDDGGGDAPEPAVGSTTTSSTTSTTQPTVVAGYTLLSSDDWPLVEAHDPPADDRISNLEQPALDWYAEYERMVGSQPERVRVSGHLVPLAEAVDDLSALEFEMEERGEGVASGRSSDPVGPNVVLVERGERTVMLLSYELDLEALMALVDDLVDTDSEGWLAAGGTVG